MKNYKSFYNKYYEQNTILKKEELCKIKCKNCQYYKTNNTENTGSPANQDDELSDIEDLNSNEEYKFHCPFNNMKMKVEVSNLILIPYFLFFNDYFRKEYNLDVLIKDSIIIMDEADSLLLYISDASNYISIEYQDVIKSLDFLGIIINESKNDMKIFGYLEMLKDALFSLWKKNSNNNSNDRNISVDINVIINVFCNDNYFDIINHIESFIDKNNNDLVNIHLKKIKAFRSLLRSITDNKKDSYICHLTLSDINNDEDEKELNFRLEIGSLDTGKSFHDILSKKPYKIILASANLSPMESFGFHFNHNFFYKYQGNHIINEKQLIFRIISHFKYNGNFMDFNFSYKNKYLDVQYEILGNLLYDLVQVTPDGIIIFFTSFIMMQNCIEIWHKNDIFKKIDDKKKIFLDIQPIKCKQNEYDNDKIANEPIIKYKNEINSGKGAIIISSFKEKLFTNIKSFEGKYGRLLINVGIPYPNYKKDERILLKEKYYFKNDKNVKKRNKWYSYLTAMKLNESFGKIINNKNDFGVILNIDSRNAEYINYFPKWLLASRKKESEYIFNSNDENNIKNNLFILDIKSFFKRQRLK